MRVPEVLAPAGNLASFRAALAGGADAVYCGLGNRFNARRSADNLDEAQLAEACRAAHLAGARVYLTVNIAIQADELPQALSLVARAGCAGVDGVIVQDWGLFAEVRRRYPQLELHVSTQANIHDARAAAWLGEQGASRVTLSRELSLPQIALIAQAGPEVEVFAHGALCFCYSGLCMMSALRGPRSANRGLCAQPCRLPHELVDEKGRRVGPVAWERGLCPKDAKATGHLAELAEADVAALKLEGRMKGPEYVLSVVSAYREALDRALEGLAPGDDVERRLKRAFNRDFTDAYLRGRSGNEMMSYERSNNRGELVGAVCRSRGRTATVRTEAPLGKGDLLELRPVERPDQFLTALCPCDVPAGGTVCVDLKRPMEPGTPVRVLRSQEALDAAAAVQGREFPRKRPVAVHVTCRLGEPLRVALTALPTLHGAEVAAQAEGPVVEAARTRALTQEDVAEHVSRLGTSPFEAASVTVDLDPGCGLGFSVLHRVRAQAAEALEEAVLAPFAQRAATMGKAPGIRALERDLARSRREAGLGEPSAQKAPIVELALQAQVCVLVEDPEAARAALAVGADRVYAPVDALAAGGFPEGTVPLLDEVCREPDRPRQDAALTPGAPCAVGNLSELLAAAAAGALPEVRGCVPVHNPSCATFLQEAGAQGFWLSPELSLPQVARVCASTDAPCGLVVWGHTRAMTSEHCVLQMADACRHRCEDCELRRQRLFLENIDGRRLPVRTDVHGRSRIWWSEPLDAVPLLDRVLKAGVVRLGIDATLLTADQTAEQVRRLRGALEALADGGALPGPWPRSTTGHLLRPVD